MSDAKDSSSGEPGGKRRSRFGIRLKARGIVECRVGLAGSSSNIAEGLLNISEDGAEVAATEAVEVGRRVELRFTGPEFWQPIIVLAKAVRSAPMEGEDGLFSVGVKFDERMSDDLLRKLAFAK